MLLTLPLLPSPSQTSPILPIINTNHIQAGAAFGRQGSRTPQKSADNSVGHILDVSINGQSYDGYIFDTNITRIN